MHRKLLPLAVVVAAWSLLLSAAQADAADARPNVLILLTDDQGYGDFSAHGNPVLKTPNLDRLREQCIRFTDFHAAPMCTPTRGELLTGCDAVRNGATSVTGGRAFLRHDIPTMPEMFAAAGYKTGLFGKWHLGDNYPHRPTDRGFQEAVYHEGWGFTSAPEFTNTLFDGTYIHNGEHKRFEGHCTDFWFSEAMNWMRERKENDEPFFCYLPTNAPHTPHVVAEKYCTPYKNTGRAERFFGMIAQIDENVGRLEEFLDETGLAENTIVIFMTDNGGTYGVQIFNAGMRGGKTTFYEGGHRVPCWVRWPAGKLGEPRDIDVPTQVQDVLPTLLELCNVPKADNAKFDGTSLAKLLRGEADDLPERTFVVQYSRAKLTKGESCVISGKWRLVHAEELYDVSTDRAQERDLAKEHPEIAAKLREHYERWWTELEPLSRTFVTTILGSEKQPVVELTSSDWQDIYSDNAVHICNAVGGPRGGHWNVDVERAGEYKVTLRRWPKELNLAMTSGDVVADIGGGPVNGKAIPIARASVQVGDAEATAEVPPGASEVVLRLKLEKGPARFQAWFSDANGRDLCGAYYADVERVE